MSLINHFQISWDSFKSNISNGLSQLQQSEEFVDMTLAAEGHLVKVHRNLIALSSPYLKEMLKTAPCQHPVIFLHNISHKVLSLILEYIYTGEVQIPNDMLDPFIKACKTLHIHGAADIDPQYIPKQRVNIEEEESSISEVHSHIQATPEEELTHPTVEKLNFAAHITINRENNLEVETLENYLDQDNHMINNYDQINQNSLNWEHVIPDNVRHLQVTSENDHKTTPLDVPMIDTSTDFLDDVTTSYNKQSSDCPLEPVKMANNYIGKPNIKEFTPQYSVSNRGCLQLILNRFIYNRHHGSEGGRKKRWRCINYRRMHCPALIDTDGEILTSRKGIHCHSFHDNVILKKMNTAILFNSIISANQLAANRNGTTADQKKKVDRATSGKNSKGSRSRSCATPVTG